MKRTILAVAAAVTLFAAQAASAETLSVISSGSLNMRQGPGTNFHVVTQLPRGTDVDVIERQGGWVKIKTKSGAVGWVSASYLGEKTPIQPQKQQPKSEPQPQQQNKQSQQPGMKPGN